MEDLFLIGKSDIHIYTIPNATNPVKSIEKLTVFIKKRTSIVTIAAVEK